MARAEIEGITIVLRGQFNPAIFHPSWFAAQELLRPNEADTADLQLVHPEAAIFQAEWLQINVVRDRFIASTTLGPYNEPLRDLVAGTFGLLHHTPLTALGINREFHFSMGSEKAWHAIGNRLAPKQDWEGIVTKPGLRSLIIEGQRSDDLRGFIQVKVEPSRRITTGLFVEVNDHYQLSDEPAAKAEMAIDILNRQWVQSMDRSLAIAEKIVGLEGVL